jgi:outer membrane protein
MRAVDWRLAVVGLVVLASAPASAQAPAPAPAASTAAGKIGFIDVQRVLARSAAGVAAREQLEKEKGVVDKELGARRQELEKLREEIDKKGSLLSADARREKQELFERKRRDAARMADDYQKELEKKEQNLLAKVLQELSGVIDKLGKERGYYLIVEKRGAVVLYAAADADLTDEVIRAYDQQVGTPKGKP